MNIDYVWIIYRESNKIAESESFILKNILESSKVDVHTIISGMTSSNSIENYATKNGLPNLAIVLGGDGTVLEAAHFFAIHEIPILSFNIGGQLGFLTHDKSLLKDPKICENLRKDKFKIEQRMMIQAQLKSKNSRHLEKRIWALNDFYIRSNQDLMSPTCTLEVQIDSEDVDQYRGDGLIISTATGSTAYSMASGGPILHPNIEAIIICAICPMSLSSRPIVVPGNSQIIIKPIGKRTNIVNLWQDGNSGFTLEAGDSCLIQKAPKNAKMILLEKSPSYYRTLANKLRWAGSIGKNE